MINFAFMYVHFVGPVSFLPVFEKLKEREYKSPQTNNQFVSATF